ncbi:MAG: hypothetical protein LBH62_06860 [Nitrososphaerota archaeon]|jgi:hypothetical protein|uniref:hypothetical protein n=1 Tax=Candidatus Bathycorpusculum sp. TaxID=2994959 RepID=UPI002839934A|nr:hypothetical protein [Candidatus Termiticorpusculum sp.]MCL2257046.1 hypothetical protein [Candidatus Termiticorpusculum sp.]MCL2292828.1 hypothetical protein [Candidatus Termiticorpusculum sp.]MDR0461133.1 hypothetical protein [Nitrososphaerota archaeon]
MSKKTYLVIVAVVVLAVVLIAGIYVLRSHQKWEIGVKAGDEFTYKMTGCADVPEFDVAIPANYLDVNKTDYYRVKITNVEYPFVTYIETTQFKNGTSFSAEGTLNVENGANTNEGGFWGIFVTNLKVGSLSRPTVPEGITVNDTETRSYLDGDRQTIFLYASGTFYDTDDETLSRTYITYTYLHVDKEIGILVELKDIQMYNDPKIILTTTWELVDSNVLQVS